jgi:hypothetical protein
LGASTGHDPRRQRRHRRHRRIESSQPTREPQPHRAHPAGRQRKIRVTLLREDGSGQPYTRPGKNNTDRFLQLPHTFWLDGWWEKLDLPATAMLLVALHEKPGFHLASERVPDWYGWSADTAERGFTTLEKLDLITKTPRLKKAPLSPTGLTKVNEYRLIGPFTPPKKSTTTGRKNARPKKKITKSAKAKPR